MTDVDIFNEDAKIQEADGAATARKPGGITLAGYGDNDYLTKPEMCRAFACSERTLQRMVERYQLPPAAPLGGRKLWIAGKVRGWIANAVDRQEAAALKEAKRLRALDL